MYFEYCKPVEVKVINGFFDYIIPLLTGIIGVWSGHLLTVKRTNEFNKRMKEEEQFQQRFRFYREMKEKDYGMVFLTIVK